VKVGKIILVVVLSSVAARVAAAGNPAFSPSGARLAWEENGRIGLVEVYRAKQSVLDLSPADLEAIGMVWRSEKELLVLARKVTGSGPVQVLCVRSAGEKPEVLFRLGSVGRLKKFVLDRGSSLLRILSRDSSGWKLVDVSLDGPRGMSEKRLSLETERIELSDDGGKILAATEAGTLLIDAANPEKAVKVSPAPFVASRPSPSVSWAPDGSAVAFVVRDDRARTRAKIRLIRGGRLLDAGAASGIGNFDRSSKSVLVLRDLPSVGTSIGRFYLDTGRMVMVADGKGIRMLSQDGDCTAVILGAEDGPYGFPDARLLLYRAFEMMPVSVSFGARTIEWSPDGESLAFICPSRVRPGRTASVLGIWLGQYSDPFYFALDDDGQMARGDMFYRSGLYVSAGEVYAAMLKRLKGEERDIDFALLPRLIVTLHREGAPERAEPKKRKVYHALHHNPELFDEVASAFRALKAYKEGVDLFTSYAESYRDSPRAIRGIISSLNLADEAGDRGLLRRILFDKGIPIYSDLLIAKHPRIRYEPAFFDFLSREVAARSPQVVQKSPGQVDILSFISDDVLGTFPPVVLKGELRTKLHLIIARTRRYRGKLRVAMSSYKRALLEAPPGYDKTAIWREVFETEAQLVGLRLPRPPW